MDKLAALNERLKARFPGKTVTISLIVAKGGFELMIDAETYRLPYEFLDHPEAKQDADIDRLTRERAGARVRNARRAQTPPEV
jgi:hypothetical protein